MAGFEVYRAVPAFTALCRHLKSCLARPFEFALDLVEASSEAAVNRHAAAALRQRMSRARAIAAALIII